MKPTYATPEEFAADLIKHAKGAWVNDVFEVSGRIVEIKMFDLWIQRIQRHDRPYYLSESFKNQRAFKTFIKEQMS